MVSGLGQASAGFVAGRQANSDRVVAICMAMAAALLALCGTGVFGATGTMVVLAATGFAISPIVFGAFMDRSWFGATLFGVAAVLLLSVVAALGVGKRTAR